MDWETFFEGKTEAEQYNILASVHSFSPKTEEERQALYNAVMAVWDEDDCCLCLDIQNAIIAAANARLAN